MRQSARHGGVLFLPVVGALRDCRVGYLSGVAHQPLDNIQVDPAVEHQHSLVHRPFVGLCVGTTVVISAAAPQLAGVSRFEGCFVRKAQRGQQPVILHIQALGALVQRGDQILTAA